MIVAIDGPAGVGKSALSSYIAQELGFFKLNSGKFYRALTLLMLRAGLSPQDEEEVIALARCAQLELKEGRLYLNGEDVEDLLHSDEVSQAVSSLSAIVPVRHILNELFRQLGKAIDLVAEGRDMTTVVFPEGEVKIYLDASPESRAQRRFDQKVSDLGYEEILESIKKRDDLDRNKKEGSLIIAEGALYLDTTALTFLEVCDRVVKSIKNVKSNLGEA